MPKQNVFNLASLLRPLLQRQNTRYGYIIPIAIIVICIRLSMQLFFEFCIIGSSTISNMLHDTCHEINIALYHKYVLVTNKRLVQTQHEFKALCNLPTILGAINNTHNSIAKSQNRSKRLILFSTPWCKHGKVDNLWSMPSVKWKWFNSKY